MPKPKGGDLAHWSPLKEARVACVELVTCLPLLPRPSLGREELLRIKRKKVWSLRWTAL